MDVRLSPEQRALRDAAVQLVGRLGPSSVGALDDAERTAKLDAALAATGWRELRVAEEGDRPLASGVEVAIVAEELGRGLVDAPFLGPTLAAELRRRAGAPAAAEAETVALTAHLSALAHTADGAVGVDAAGATSALVLTADGLGTVALAPGDVVDLTRPSAVPDGPVTPVEGATLDDDALTAWTALGLATTSADLVGTMQGAVTLAAGYAAERRQYGVPVGSFQAVQHLLADALVATEGSRSVTLHAAWAVDALPPGEALVAASVAKAYCARAARTVCETAIQVHGGIGNTWECLAHVHLRRALLAADVLGGVGPNLARVLDHHGLGEELMDFGDSPEEAAFRERLRAWLVDNNPGLPASSTSDEYWEGQAPWHQALYDAGFFAMSWPIDIGGQDLPSVYEVIVDDELAAAGAPPRPSLGYLVWGILEHAGDDVKQRFLPGIVNGRERWCQGFSEPDAGSDLAALRTRAERDGDEWVITGHKVWTSYSDLADWCLVLVRTDPDVPKHKGLSAFAVRMDQPGIEQRPLKMINGVTREFGEVAFDGARVPDADMIGPPGAGWRLAMTVVSHEREPGELGYVSRYRKSVSQLARQVRQAPERHGDEAVRDLGWAIVEAEMLRAHVCRRLSDRLDGIVHGPEGSIDKLLMTEVEQAVGHAALAVGGAAHDGGDDTWLKLYLYSRAQSVMGGTAQIQRNLVATRILELPTS